MSAPQWKPGDVVTVGGGDSWRRAIVKASPRVQGQLELSYFDSGYDNLLDRLQSAQVRPLVVIDPEDADQLDALGKAWDEAESCNLDNEQPMTMRALRMRVALRSLVTPPRPDEPQGLGAVVEDEKGKRWLRCLVGARPWVVTHDAAWIATAWSEITAVRVLSVGVTV